MDFAHGVNVSQKVTSICDLGGERMSEKKLHCSRYIGNFNPPDLTKKLVHKVCESVADVFLGQIEYGRDYVISTELVKEDWADGFGTKYTYYLSFEPLVRCRDCYFADEIEGGYWCDRSDCGKEHVTPNGFCAWGERREE